MAMYHFRIKSDKKPNGTKISAVQHVEYINREGKFSTPEQWQQKNKFVGDFNHPLCKTIHRITPSCLLHGQASP